MSVSECTLRGDQMQFAYLLTWIAVGPCSKMSLIKSPAAFTCAGVPEMDTCLFTPAGKSWFKNIFAPVRVCISCITAPYEFYYNHHKH